MPETTPRYICLKCGWTGDEPTWQGRTGPFCGECPYMVLSWDELARWHDQHQTVGRLCRNR